MSLWKTEEPPPGTTAEIKLLSGGYTTAPVLKIHTFRGQHERIITLGGKHKFDEEPYTINYPESDQHGRD